MRNTGDCCVLYFSKNLTLQCLQGFGVRNLYPFVGYHFYTKNLGEIGLFRLRKQDNICVKSA